jgi:hypothetical protein
MRGEADDNKPLSGGEPCIEGESMPVVEMAQILGSFSVSSSQTVDPPLQE